MFDPKPGPIISQQPPAPVEEVPPDTRPEGENVAWIPGYWAWDDDTKQFIWVSGFWRELPPGRVWVPGYWNSTPDGSQWVGGYWAPAGTGDAPVDAEYLPEPPASLETGPQGVGADDQIWVPGLWVWQTGRYAWRPGFWATGYQDWVWMPAQYQWSPLGYLYTPGYWDYPLWRRGVLFAPVAFNAYRPGLTFTPRLALNSAYLGYSLFARPQTGSYYFGDYYANNYFQSGYYPWFSFHNTRYGYDPMFAHADWVYARQNIDWESRLRQVYYARRDDPAARPPRVYREYARGTADRGESALVRPLAELRTARDLPFKMQPVSPVWAKQAVQNAQAVRTFGAERAKLEGARVRELESGPQGMPQAPVRMQLPNVPRTVSAPAPASPGARALPEHPAHPQVDLTRRPETRAPQTDVRPPVPGPKVEPGLNGPQPKVDIRPPQPQPRAPGTLPHPEDVLHPQFDRRAGSGFVPPAANPMTPAQPPVQPPRVNPPTVAPTPPAQPPRVNPPAVNPMPLPAQPPRVNPPAVNPNPPAQPPAQPPRVNPPVVNPMPPAQPPRVNPPTVAPTPPAQLPRVNPPAVNPMPLPAQPPAQPPRVNPPTAAPAPPAQPPAQPPRVNAPPAVHPVPPITGMPHPGHLPAPKGK